MSFIRSKTEVMGHWVAFADPLSLSSIEFYRAISDEISRRQVPGLRMEQIELAEGGLLSDERLYLRILRERLVFDICAAPFGSTFFFSCRTSNIPAVVKPWQIAVLLLLSYLILRAFFSVFGVFAGSIWFFIALISWAYVLRNAIALGLSDLDRTLLQMPLFGDVYEAWFRKETYFREDTRLVYLELVQSLVKEAAEEACAKHGIKLQRQYTRAPVLGDLYRPARTSDRDEPSKDRGSHLSNERVDI